MYDSYPCMTQLFDVGFSQKSHFLISHEKDGCLNMKKNNFINGNTSRSKVAINLYIYHRRCYLPWLSLITAQF